MSRNGDSSDLKNWPRVNALGPCFRETNPAFDEEAVMANAIEPLYQPALTATHWDSRIGRSLIRIGGPREVHNGSCDRTTEGPFSRNSTRPGSARDCNVLHGSARHVSTIPQCRRRAGHSIILRRHRRPMLRRMEQTHRTTLAHHVHRFARMGEWALITAGWNNSVI